MSRSALLILATALGLGLPACDGLDAEAPPELRVGRSECAECGMIINEDRCSSGLIADDRGRRDGVVFDDIGCMLDAEHEGLEGRAVLRAYVHDHESRRWIDAAQAWYLFTPNKDLYTPMGSGIIAFGGPQAASEAQQRWGGRVLRLDELREARRAWKAERSRSAMDRREGDA